MPNQRILLPFLGLLLSCLTVVASPSDHIPLTDPKIFAGRKLKDYPELFLVKRTKHMNIFWSGRSNCTDAPSPDTVVDQRNAERIQSLLETVVEDRIKKFEQFAKANMPNWESKVSRQLYPLNIRIEMEIPIICGGANRYNLGVYAGEGKPTIILQDQLILESGGKFRNEDEEKGFVSIKMHELGHLIARSIGYPRFKGINNLNPGPLEETIADFVGFVGNQNNPRIGGGLSDIIDADYCSKLSENLEPFERARIESLCRVHSSEAMRDLRLPLQYSDLYKFPEQHHIAGHSNALFYRLGKIVGLDVLFRSFMTQFFTMDESVFDAEIFIFAKAVLKRAILEKPQSKAAVLQAVKGLGWKASTSSRHVLIKKSLTENEKAIQLVIEPESSLVAEVFDYPIVNINLKAGKKTNFSMTYLGDFWKPIAALLKVSSCSISNYDCRCFKEGESLSADAVYLDKQENIRRTSTQLILTFGKDARPGCFKFGAD